MFEVPFPYGYGQQLWNLGENVHDKKVWTVIGVRPCCRRSCPNLIVLYLLGHEHVGARGSRGCARENWRLRPALEMGH